MATYKILASNGSVKILKGNRILNRRETELYLNSLIYNSNSGESECRSSKDIRKAYTIPVAETV